MISDIPDNIMATAMGPQGAGVRDPFAHQAVASDAVRGNEIQHGCVVVVHLVHGRAYVSLQDPGIVSESAVRARGRPDGGSQVHRHVGEGARLDVSAARTSRKLDAAAEHARRWGEEGAVVDRVLSVSTQAVRAKEDRRVLGRILILGPVPVL